MNDKINIESFVEANKKNMDNYNQIKAKHDVLQNEVMKSIETKKARFNERKSRHEKDFSFLRNK